MDSPGLGGRSLLALVALLAGCFEERARPAPLEPSDSALVLVELLRPEDNATVIAGRTLVVEILARAEEQNLSGIGYVIRLVQGGGRVDSAARRFGARTLARDSFQVTIPAQLQTNTHLAISALAFPAVGRTRYSPATQVVVAQCTPDIPACR
jgi:hypothetical protein